MIRSERNVQCDRYETIASVSSIVQPVVATRSIELLRRRPFSELLQKRRDINRCYVVTQHTGAMAAIDKQANKFV